MKKDGRGTETEAELSKGVTEVERGGEKGSVNGCTADCLKSQRALKDAADLILPDEK